MKKSENNTTLETLKHLTDRLTIRDFEEKRMLKTFSLILNQVPGIILATTDNDLNITTCFGKGLKYFGLHSSDFVGKTIDDIPTIFNFDKNEVYDDKKLNKLKKELHCECVFKLGGHKWILMIEPLFDDDLTNQLGYIGVLVRDGKI
jgi:PAS domain-containing protein